jgi:hypothetical protein
MAFISYPGSTLVLPLLIALAAVIFWVVRLRLEAVVIVALSAVSAVLNLLLKLLVARPRPTAGLVEVFQATTGASFPSGHVMAYLAFWGLLFADRARQEDHATIRAVALFPLKASWSAFLIFGSRHFVSLMGLLKDSMLCWVSHASAKRSHRASDGV